MTLPLEDNAPWAQQEGEAGVLRSRFPDGARSEALARKSNSFHETRLVCREHLGEGFLAGRRTSLLPEAGVSPAQALSPGAGPTGAPTKQDGA